MNYAKINQKALGYLEEIVGFNDVLSERDRIVDYTHDESSVEPHYPEAVVRAETAEEVSFWISYKLNFFCSL